MRLWVKRGIAVAFAATVATGAFGAGGAWAGRTIHVPFAANAPTIDGSFSLVEWSAATGARLIQSPVPLELYVPFEISLPPKYTLVEVSPK